MNASCGIQASQQKEKSSGHGLGETWSCDGNSQSAGSTGKDGGPFVDGEFLPFSNAEAAEGKRADAFTEKSQGGVADSCGHAANLSILAFPELESKPGVDDVLTIANRRIAVGNGRSLFEGLGPAGKTFVAFDHDGSAAEFFE